MSHRLGRRAVAVDLGAGARRQPFDIEQVLHREGRASKRAEALSARSSRIDRVSLGERPLRGDVGESAERAVAGLDALRGFLGRSRGRSPRRSDRRGDCLGGSLDEARRVMREHRRGLRQIVERNRKKLLRLLRRDPQMHNGLSARFRGQRKPSNGAIASTTASGSNLFAVTPSPHRMRGTRCPAEMFFFGRGPYRASLSGRPRNCRHHPSPISGRSYRRSSPLSRTSQTRSR